jgi:uncharacterized protein YdaU (DUF1376 family)
VTKKSDTWMPFYVTDYLGDTMHLTTTQHGAYLLLLLACWKAGGDLPDDDAQLSAITRMTVNEWRKTAPVLRKYFDPVDGLLSHGRVKFELQKAKQLSDMRSAVGKAGGRPRKQKQEDNQTETNRFPEGKANVKQNETPSPSPSQLPTGIQPLEPKELDQPPSKREGGFEDVSTPSGTDAGRICKAMKAAGIADVNPSNQTLLTLLSAGATDGEFTAAAATAAGCAKGFGYALGIVANERKRAAVLAQQVLHGTLPAAETTYQRSMRERMQEVAPEAARRDPSHPAHAADFFNAIEVQTRTVEQIR